MLHTTLLSLSPLAIRGQTSPQIRPETVRCSLLDPLHPSSSSTPEKSGTWIHPFLRHAEAVSRITSSRTLCQVGFSEPLAADACPANVSSPDEAYKLRTVPPTLFPVLSTPRYSHLPPLLPPRRSLHAGPTPASHYAIPGWLIGGAYPSTATPIEATETAQVTFLHSPGNVLF